MTTLSVVFMTKELVVMVSEDTMIQIRRQHLIECSVYINIYILKFHHILISDKRSKKFMSLNFNGGFEIFLQWEV
jgi:hypothetical protein